MRSGASRFGLTLLAVCLVAVLCGCSSTTKRDYLKHLSTVIAPVEPGTPGQPAPAVAVAEPDNTSR
jgi:hypothetical protein